MSTDLPQNLNQLFGTAEYLSLRREIGSAHNSHMLRGHFDKNGIVYGFPLGPNAAIHPAYGAIMRMAFRSLSSRESRNVLDLGASIGCQVLYAAHDGCDAFGIEFEPGHLACAKENILLAIASGYIPEGKAQVAMGNFFTADDVVESSSHEDRFRNYLNKTASDAKHITNNPFGEGTYVDFLKTIDLFSHYQVEREQNLLNFFARHAKAGADLLIVKTMRDSPALPAGVRLDKTGDAMRLYTKA